MREYHQRRPTSLRSWRYLVLVSVVSTLVASLCAASSDKAAFDYSECLFGRPKTLHVSVARMDPKNGTVECNGCDNGRPQQPFTWDWGDGETSTGFFPQTHSYKDHHRNYVVKVTSHYPDGKNDTAEAIVHFCPPAGILRQVELRSDVRVVVPSEKPHLRPARAPYGVSSNLTVFDDSFFQTYSRKTIEYVLTVGAVIQMDLANDDVCKTNGRFDQVLLRNPKCRGMHSVWYTDPVCFGVGDYAFTSEIQWSSFFHEMGHNVTLNSPARFHWGFKQDGPANCIYSETMAQIFQHATAYELVNHWEKYGISRDLMFDIGRSARSSMYGVRCSYEKYREDGCCFCSWNDSRTEQDDTFETFMTVAYKFFEHAEKNGHGYRQPVKRLMAFLQRFNPDWAKRFSARKNSPHAEQFRATLAVASLSYAFDSDLRQEFRNLLFPISDDIFRELMTSGSTEKGNKAE